MSTTISPGAAAPTPRNRRIAALIGNGMSIAHNRDLMLGSINEEILNRLNTAAGSAVNPVAYLQELSSQLGQTGDASVDFEAICGPLEQMSDALTLLQKFLDADPDPVKKMAMRLTRQEIGRIHRQGVGHVLEVIAERSIASYDAGTTVSDFMKDLVAASDGGRITIGNLNYDSLLLADLSRNWGPDSCDMTAGYRPTEQIEVVPGHYLTGRPLRDWANFPGDRQIRLLHLHGSLAWLREPGTGRVLRFEMEDLRSAEYWESWRTGTTAWKPVVVLTNQARKSATVAANPFKLGYDTFYNELLTAYRWTIVGYSFRDECVNDVLARAWAARRGNPPSVLVVTKGTDPSVPVILRALGYDSSIGDPRFPRWLHVTRDGIGDVSASRAWGIWSGNVKVLVPVK